jgi:hypothetical protein
MKKEEENNSKDEGFTMARSAEFQVRLEKEQNLTSVSSIVESTDGSSRHLFCKQNDIKWYRMQQINVKWEIKN